MTLEDLASEVEALKQRVAALEHATAAESGSPVAIATMLDFAARHRIAPQVEHFPAAKVNDALDRLRSGKARYRVVLDAAGA